MKYSQFKQFVSELCPPNPTLTEKDYPDLTGKIYIVTGGPTGIGFHTSKFLLQKNAKVWVAARSQTKIDAAIEKFKEEIPDCNVDSFLIDFSDLATIKPGVQKFLDTETRLDGIIHNAGVMNPPEGSKTKQGYELQLGVNNIGPHLLQKYLDDIIINTAKTAPKNSVRIVYVASNALNFSTKGGINWDDINYRTTKAQAFAIYGQSKAINVCSAILWAKKHENSGVVTLSLNPGALKSELARHNTSKILDYMGNLLLYPAHMGAYTELFAALSPKFTTEDSGTYIIPWGRVGEVRDDVLVTANGEAGEKLWSWLEEQIKPYY